MTTRLDKQPNIIFILIDDMGWRDLYCYGSEFYETPHIDRLAAEGMKFTDAYASCPVCSPTRASIMTGKYPATVGITDWIDHEGKLHPCKGRLVDAPYLKELPLCEKSIAVSLKEGGYQTWHVGKWHLGGRSHYPEDHGFEVNIGGCYWGHPKNGYFSPYGIETLEDGPTGEYLTDRITEEAIKLIKNRDATRPFFLNLWHYAVHTPIQAKEEDIERFELKAARLGLDKAKAMDEGEFYPCDHKKDLRVQRRLIQSDPTYAAMIFNLDWNIGRLLKALEELGVEEETVVFFTSDNGGLATDAGSPTSNRPLHEGKGWMYDGGVREPLIIKWPGKIKEGSVCSCPVTSTDFYPTFLEIADLPLNTQQHIDGVSLLPLIERAETLEREAIYWHYPHYGNQGGTPGSAIRMGDYKLIEFYEDGGLELYNLREDIGEKCNVAERMPDLTRKMQEMLAQWRKKISAKLPERNQDWVIRQEG